MIGVLTPSLGEGGQGRRGPGAARRQRQGPEQGARVREPRHPARADRSREDHLPRDVGQRGDIRTVAGQSGARRGHGGRLRAMVEAARVGALRSSRLAGAPAPPRRPCGNCSDLRGRHTSVTLSSAGASPARIEGRTQPSRRWWLGPTRRLSCAGPSVHPDEASGYSGRTGGVGTLPPQSRFR